MGAPGVFRGIIRVVLAPPVKVSKSPFPHSRFYTFCHFRPRDLKHPDYTQEHPHPFRTAFGRGSRGAGRRPGKGGKMLERAPDKRPLPPAGCLVFCPPAAQFRLSSRNPRPNCTVKKRRAPGRGLKTKRRETDESNFEKRFESAGAIWKTGGYSTFASKGEVLTT